MTQSDNPEKPDLHSEDQSQAKLKTINLKQALKDVGVKETTKDNLKIEDVIAQKDNNVASWLAFGMWGLLGFVVLFHIASTAWTSHRMLNFANSYVFGNESSDRTSEADTVADTVADTDTQESLDENILKLFDQAQSNTNNTATNIYTFLGPITAGITAYYFRLYRSELKDK